MSVDCEALIVGAGPVGLALAAELEIAGVHAVVLEQLTEPDPRQKGRGVGLLGSEALRRRGLGTRLQNRHETGRVDFRQDMGSPNAHFAWIHKVDHGSMSGRLADRTPAFIWQPDLERLLAEHADAHGATVLRGHTVTALHQDEKCVRVAVDTPEGAREFTAAYVVGCDGGRSSVRKLAGFEFPGIDGTVVTLVARLRVADPESFPAPVATARGSLQHGGVFDGWVRPRVSEPDNTPPGIDRDRSLVTAQEMHDAIERITGADVPIIEISEGRRAVDNSRQAATYRMGRVLLAGDAAHVHNPMGGQGLSLGIMDAVNLGWKLAAVIRGTGGDALLDSYTSERHPAGARVLLNTRAQSALLVMTPQAQALRELFSSLMDLPEVKQYLGEMLSGLDIRYHLPYDPGSDHELLGYHVPNFVVDDTTLYALMSDGRPVLLHTPPAAGVAGAAAPWADRVQVVDALVLGRLDLTAALIRPDGVLAWAATPGEPPKAGPLTAALHTWFGMPRDL